MKKKTADKTAAAPSSSSSSDVRVLYFHRRCSDIDTSFSVSIFPLVHVVQLERLTFVQVVQSQTCCLVTDMQFSESFLRHASHKYSYTYTVTDHNSKCLPFLCYCQMATSSERAPANAAVAVPISSSSSSDVRVLYFHRRCSDIDTSYSVSIFPLVHVVRLERLTFVQVVQSQTCWPVMDMHFSESFIPLAYTLLDTAPRHAEA
jgi:hypothetical protein